MASRNGIAEDATDLIGNTPMVYLRKIGRGLPGNIAAKLEYMNPACSVKDRIAYNMVRQAEEEGRIRPGVSTIIEYTSGNTGVGLAFVGAARGYRVIIAMPEAASLERRVLIKAYGAELVLTDPALGTKGLVERANELHANIPNSIILAQFDNPANPAAHYGTTGPEIWRQTNGKVDVCVFGVGTGGTITGVGRFLKERNPNIKIFAVEPEESPVLSGGEPGTHKIQGIGAGIVPSVLGRDLLVEIIKVHSDDAIFMAKRMACEEGILCGISAGANVTAATRLASRPEMAGKLIVTVTPSFGERYLSTPLFSEVREEAEALKVQSLEENLSHLKLHDFEVLY